MKTVKRKLLIGLAVLSALLILTNIYSHDLYLAYRHIKHPNPIKWNHLLINLPHDSIIANPESYQNNQELRISTFKHQPAIHIFFKKRDLRDGHQLLDNIELAKKYFEAQGFSIESLQECQILKKRSLCVRGFDFTNNKAKYFVDILIPEENLAISYSGSKNKSSFLFDVLKNSEIL